MIAMAIDDDVILSLFVAFVLGLVLLVVVGGRR